ncbi:MAG: VWA domain-containing protein [Chloroflexota bacterium]
MRTDYTHITVILDRTGSMESIRDDTIGGFNAFLAQHTAQPGTATLTLVQFDSQDPYEVIHRAKPLGEVSALTRETYVPRASTPLLDAMGRGINDLEATLAAMAEADRPEQVIMVIVTDGQENASREFHKGQIEKMIRARQEAGWQFVFLSADLAAIGDALSTGIAAAQALAHDKTAAGPQAAWAAVSANMAAFRAKTKRDMAFTDDDRNQQNAEKHK